MIIIIWSAENEDNNNHENCQNKFDENINWQ